METTVTLPDALFDELVGLTQAKSRSEAVEVALQRFLEQAKREQLRTYRGKIDVLSDEEMEAAEPFSPKS